jgi:hypothetical protein
MTADAIDVQQPVVHPLHVAEIRLCRLQQRSQPPLV